MSTNRHPKDECNKCASYPRSILNKYGLYSTLFGLSLGVALMSPPIFAFVGIGFAAAFGMKGRDYWSKLKYEIYPHLEKKYGKW